MFSMVLRLSCTRYGAGRLNRGLFSRIVLSVMSGLWLIGLEVLNQSSSMKTGYAVVKRGRRYTRHVECSTKHVSLFLPTRKRLKISVVMIET